MDLRATRLQLTRDLEYNRAGQLSPEQIKALRQHYLGNPQLRTLWDEDLAQGAVACVEGTIVGHRVPYLAAALTGQVPGWNRALQVVYGLLVPPGPYLLYYLPHALYVVAVEVPPQNRLQADYRGRDLADPIPVTPAHCDAYATLLGHLQQFSGPADLAELRSGRVPSSVESRLRAERVKFWWFWLGITVGSVLVPIMGTLVYAGYFGLAILAVLGAWWLVWWLWRRIRNQARAIAVAGVRCLEGPIALEVEPAMNLDDHDRAFLHIGGERLPVEDSTVFQFLDSAFSYRVYVSSYNNKILAIEPT